MGAAAGNRQKARGCRLINSCGKRSRRPGLESAQRGSPLSLAVFNNIRESK